MNEWQQLEGMIILATSDARVLRNYVAELYKDGFRREEANRYLVDAINEVRSTLATAAAYLPSMSLADLEEHNKTWLASL